MNMSDAVPVIFNHNIDKVDYIDFILYNIRTLELIRHSDISIGPQSSPAFGEYYIHVYSSNKKTPPQAIDSVYEQIEQKVKYCYDLQTWRIKDKQEKTQLESLIFGEHLRQPLARKILHLESDMLLSQQLISFVACLNITENIYVPLIHFKYNYKNVSYASKEFKVRNYIKSTTGELFQHQDLLSDVKTWAWAEGEYLPDWDERLSVTHDTFEKLQGRLPTTPPSPLVHNWQTYTRLLSTREEGKVFVPNSYMAIHKFEKVETEVQK